MFCFISFIAGGLFGLGMAISGMVDPVNVIAFLDVSGDWSADLIFVIGGAIAVFMPAYFWLIKPRQAPVFAEEFSLPKSNRINVRLIVGASIFGLGWGLVGLCPGPVVSSLSSGNMGGMVFFVTMMVGLWLVNMWERLNKK